MTAWTMRSSEERGLISPSFSALLLWHAAQGHAGDAGVALPFEPTFLVLPMVLHQRTRDSLPLSVTTSLSVWLDEHPLARACIVDGSRKLVPFTKEALSFGGLHGFLLLGKGLLEANFDWKKKVTTYLKTSTDEVRVCAKRAEFVGRWFSKAGDAATVMALIGVRP